MIKRKATWISTQYSDNAILAVLIISKNKCIQIFKTITLKSFSLGDTNNVNHLILSEDRRDWNSLLQVLTGPVNLLTNSASVHLNFHHMGFLLTLTEKFHLQQEK